MGFIREKLSRKRSPGIEQFRGGLDVAPTFSESDFYLDVAGESHYQDALASIVNGWTKEGANLETEAVLVPEPDNRYDPNAVGVWIGGMQVGHLSRHSAEVLQPCILKAISNTQRQVACRSVIRGGWDRGGHDRAHFGVRLYIDLTEFGLDADDLDGGWEG
jgi:hypothetical protein